MMMRKQSIRKDYFSLSPGQTESMCFTLESLFLPLINLSFLFFCLLFSVSLPPSFLPHLSSPHPPHLTQAALMGGTTMVMALALPEQHCSLVDAYEKCRALADAKACCDYALHVGVTWWGPKVRRLLKRSSQYERHSSTREQRGSTFIFYEQMSLCVLSSLSD